MNTRFRFTTVPGGRIVRNTRARSGPRRRRDRLYFRWREMRRDERRRRNRGEFLPGL